MMALATAVVAESSEPAIIETDIPARLDRLPWGRFHCPYFTVVCK
jgi:hypothetical protein